MRRVLKPLQRAESSPEGGILRPAQRNSLLESHRDELLPAGWQRQGNFAGLWAFACCRSALLVVLRRHKAFSDVVSLVVQEQVHLLLQIASVVGGGHAEVFFIDQHHLLSLPILPSLSRDIVENVLTLGAGVRCYWQAGQLFAVFFTENHA